MRHGIKAIIFKFFILLIYLLSINNPCLFADTLEKNNWHSKASTSINISKRDNNTKLAPALPDSNNIGIFFDDFESGQGKWKITNGLWEIGEPTSGPDSAYSGLSCSGTNLKSNYPNNAETMLISPTISLPALSKKTDQIRLIFQQWYAIEYRSDFGYVQISTDGGNNWTTEGTLSGDGSIWNYGSADLTSYAGKNVNIAFFFTSDSSYTDYGWYIDDVFLEYVESIATESLEINIASNGQFTMGIPDSTILLFGHPNPWTSATTFRIDGKDYWNYYLSSWGKVISLPKTKGLSNITTWDIDKIQFSQTLSIVEGSTTGNLDTAEIKYVVTNKDTVSHEVGVRVMLDTMLGENDGAPFRIPKAGGVTTEREFLKNNMPMYWQAFDDLSHPSFQSQGTLTGGLATIPDRFITVGWSHINETTWECETIPNQDFDYTYSDYYDSAVGIYWFPIKLGPGQSKEFVTYYGLGGIDIDIQPPLVVGLTAPEKVIINKNDISKTFTLTAYLDNSSPGVTKTATGITTELILPKGLSLAENEKAIQNIPNLRINEGMQTSYNINIGDVGGKITYSLIVTASNVAKKTVNKDIYVFGVELFPKLLYTPFIVPTIKAVFNVDMDANTFNDSTFFVKTAVDESVQSPIPIKGNIAYDPKTRTVSFEPTPELKSGTSYVATITNGVKSASGVSLPYNIVWTFATLEVEESNGFKVPRDGFSFQNYGDKDPNDDWEQFREAFGKDQVEHSNGTPKRMAQEFFDDHRDENGGGNCLGFALVSSLFFTEKLDIHDNKIIDQKVDNVYDLIPNEKMDHLIEKYQWFNFQYNWKNLFPKLNPTPKDVFNLLKKKYDEDIRNLYILVFWMLPTEAHSGVVWQVKERDGKGEVYIYDSNEPGKEDRTVIIDLLKNEWSYYVGFELWTGNGNTRSLVYHPYSYYQNPSLPILNMGFIYNITSSADIYFTDTKGRHLGFIDGEFYDDISDAGLLPSIPGQYETENPNTVQSYYLPMDVEHTTTITGKKEGKYTFKKYAQDCLLRVNTSVENDSVDQIEFDSNKYTATFQTTDKSKDYDMDIIVELSDGSAERSFKISGANLSKDGTVIMKLSDDLKSLTFTNQGTKSNYIVKVEQIGQKNGSFTSNQLIIGIDETHIIEPKNWNQISDGVIIYIDKESDGVIDDILGVAEKSPSDFLFSQNYPNPFSNETKIDYQLPRDCNVDLKIYNVTGRIVITLIDNDKKMAGYHTVRWDGKNEIGEDVVNGIYFYVIKAGNYNKAGKMIIIR